MLKFGCSGLKYIPSIFFLRSLSISLPPSYCYVSYCSVTYYPLFCSPVTCPLLSSYLHLPLPSLHVFFLSLCCLPCAPTQCSLLPRHHSRTPMCPILPYCVPMCLLYTPSYPCFPTMSVIFYQLRFGLRPTPTLTCAAVPISPLIDGMSGRQRKGHGTHSQRLIASLYLKSNGQN